MLAGWCGHGQAGPGHSNQLAEIWQQQHQHQHRTQPTNSSSAVIQIMDMDSVKFMIWHMKVSFLKCFQNIHFVNFEWWTLSSILFNVLSEAN